MKKRTPQKLQPWIVARKKHHLSHAHIQMARDLGMTPKSLDKLADCKNQSWKLPLIAYLETQYLKRFKKSQPDVVNKIE